MALRQLKTKPELKNTPFLTSPKKDALNSGAFASELTRTRILE